MSMLLILCVVAATSWLVLSLVSWLFAGTPADSVAAHTRALRALDTARGDAAPARRRRRMR